MRLDTTVVTAQETESVGWTDANTLAIRYLHEPVSLSLSHDQDRTADTSNNRSSSIPELTKEVMPRHSISQNNSDETPAMQQNRTPTLTTSSSSESSQMERISLMILPAFIENGSRQLKVNVMLDPCSTGTYMTEGAAEELCLQGDMQKVLGTRSYRYTRQRGSSMDCR